MVTNLIMNTYELAFEDASDEIAKSTGVVFDPRAFDFVSDRFV